LRNKKQLLNLFFESVKHGKIRELKRGSGAMNCFFGMRQAVRDGKSVQHHQEGVEDLNEGIFFLRPSGPTYPEHPLLQ
jgi:hypothetical protein